MDSNSIGIIGAGLAGLAAGCALADAGYQVSLFERRPYVGGRASSYEHPGTGEVVDNCQHVLLGCCTNLISFYQQIGVSDKIQWYDDLTFVEPGGRFSRIVPTFLPAPFHSTPSFFAASSLKRADKLAIGRALNAMMRMANPPDDPQENFLEWLRRHRQTEQAIQRFWKVVLVSALNEDLERISVRYAVQVFRESFMKSAAAGKMGVPRVPLSDLYGSAADYIRRRGGEVLLRCPVNSIVPGTDCAGIITNGGQRQFGAIVLAVPFQAVAALLPSDALAEPLKQNLSKFEASPITGIHLWFDREITPLPHAVLLDRTIQWMFQKTKFHAASVSQCGAPQMNITGPQPPPAASSAAGDQENARARERISGMVTQPNGSYMELVVSASKSLVEKSRQEVLDLALSELREFFPKTKEARLLKATVIKEIFATYSIVPGLDPYRPPSKTGWPRLFLAGDWTQTGWPATMEGAVRSGYRAAEAITKAGNQAKKILVPDLPAKGLMKFFE